MTTYSIFIHERLKVIEFKTRKHFFPDLLTVSILQIQYCLNIIKIDKET